MDFFHTIKIKSFLITSLKFIISYFCSNNIKVCSRLFVLVRLSFNWSVEFLKKMKKLLMEYFEGLFDNLKDQKITYQLIVID